jgi:hypothetical protein
MWKQLVSLRMFLLVLLWTTCTLQGCGGGGAGPVENIPPPSTLIEKPTAEGSYSTVCNRVLLSGSPNLSASQWQDVLVTWLNHATGETGTATTGVEQCWNIIFGPFPCNPWWWASVPLHLGENRITVEASFPTGGQVKDAITVSKPALSYALSGKITNFDGRGIHNLKVIRVDTGDWELTNSEGEYSFSCLTEGVYTVVPSAMNTSPEIRFWSQMAWPFLPQSRTVEIVAAEIRGVNFSTEVHRLEGSALPDTAISIAPLAVELTEDAGGRALAYVQEGTFTLLAPNGTYTLRAPVSNSYVYLPENLSLTVSGADIGALDFVGQLKWSSALDP